MRNDKQVASSWAGGRAAWYRRISAVFPELPHRFTSSQLYALMGTDAKGPSVRWRIAEVLRDSFHCTPVTKGNQRMWKKPGDAATLTNGPEAHQ